MSRSSTERPAKEFLIEEVVREASHEGVPLCEIERRMLFFSESGWTLRGASWRVLYAALMILVASVGFQIAVERYVGHTPDRDELAFFGWAAAAILAGSYVALLFVFGGSSVDGFIGRLTDGILGTPHE
jgi:hypothetical protein